jgi:hypothetical protein
VTKLASAAFDLAKSLLWGGKQPSASEEQEDKNAAACQPPKIADAVI